MAPYILIAIIAFLIGHWVGFRSAWDGLENVAKHTVQLMKADDCLNDRNVNHE